MIDLTIWSGGRADDAVPVMPARSFTSITAIRFSRALDAHGAAQVLGLAAVKFATAIAMRRSCSWKSGTPSVRERMGSSEGCAYDRLAPRAPRR